MAEISESLRILGEAEGSLGAIGEQIPCTVAYPNGRRRV
jgi:hypothetical protein